MNYPVQISFDNNKQSYLLKVADIAGCTISATTLDQAMEKLPDVIAEHLTILAEYGESIPHAKPLQQHVNTCQEDGVTWAIINFDITPYLGKSHKINVTLPELLIKQIDDRVNKSAQHKTRSGFIASACVELLAKKL